MSRGATAATRVVAVVFLEYRSRSFSDSVGGGSCFWWGRLRWITETAEARCVRKVGGRLLTRDSSLVEATL